MALPNPVTRQPREAPPSAPLEVSARLPVMAGDAHNYFSGTAFGNQLTYIDLASFVWWTSPRLDAPVRVHLGERLDGIFTDAQLEVTFLPNVDLPLGETYRIGDELAPDRDLYTFRIVDKTEAGGLITYVGETLVGELGRMYPRESFVLIPGQDGAPSPLTPGTALRLMLEHYGIPFAEPIPEFYFRTSQGAFTPSLDAFVIEPDVENPKSLYEILREVFEPFSGYRFRANAANQLTVAAPAWVREMGLQMRTWSLGGLLQRPSASIYWPYLEPPVATVHATALASGGASETVTLEADTPTVVALAGVTSTLEWDTTARRVTLHSAPAGFPAIFAWSVSVTLQQPPASLLVLSQADLAPDGESRISLESVINRAEVTVQGLVFESGVQVMQPSAFVLRGEAWRTASWGYQIGPGTALAGEEDEGIPDSFHVLAEETANRKTMFWPLAEGLVTQPGSSINVALQVEEWRDVWVHASGGGAPSWAALELNHTATVEVELPVDGEEHLLYTCRYEKYGIGFENNHASGKVWGRFQGGENPGVVLRVEQDPSMSGWTVLGGQAYFTYSLYVRLNGTGTVFQRAGEKTSVRFGYTRDGDAWEGGALVPGLAESQTLYGAREQRIDSGIYQLPEETAFSLARAIVEAGLNPKRVWTLGIVPNGEDGYRVQPDHLGQAVRLPWGEVGRVTSWSYDEIHSPLSDQTRLTVEVEVAEPLNRARAGRSHYRAALYRVSQTGRN